MKKLIIAALAVGLIAAVAKKQSARREEWHGMTEEQARERLGERLPNKMPDEKKAMVTDKIVTRMRDKGIIIDLTDEAATAVADEVTEETPTV